MRRKQRDEVARMIWDSIEVWYMQSKQATRCDVYQGTEGSVAQCEKPWRHIGPHAYNVYPYFSKDPRENGPGAS